MAHSIPPRHGDVEEGPNPWKNNPIYVVLHILLVVSTKVVISLDMWLSPKKATHKKLLGTHSRCMSNSTPHQGECEVGGEESGGCGVTRG